MLKRWHVKRSFQALTCGINSLRWINFTSRGGLLHEWFCIFWLINWWTLRLGTHLSVTRKRRLNLFLMLLNLNIFPKTIIGWLFLFLNLDYFWNLRFLNWRFWIQIFVQCILSLCHCDDIAFRGFRGLNLFLYVFNLLLIMIIGALGHLNFLIDSQLLFSELIELTCLHFHHFVILLTIFDKFFIKLLFLPPLLNISL